MKKVQIGFSDQALDRIEELRQARGESSPVGVLRAALNLYSWLYDQAMDGYSVGVFRDGKCKKTVLHAYFCAQTSGSPADATGHAGSSAPSGGPIPR